MNDAQKLWWEQAKSDHAVFVLLRRAGVPECHMLHYLQMAAEKISKAYLWRSGTAPPRSHIGLMPFLQALLSLRLLLFVEGRVHFAGFRLFFRRGRRR